MSIRFKSLGGTKKCLNEIIPGFVSSKVASCLQMVKILYLANDIVLQVEDFQLSAGISYELNLFDILLV